MVDSPTAGVFGVLVSYQPQPKRLQQVLEAVAPQVQHLLVVDNSETEQAQAQVQNAIEAIKGFCEQGAHQTVIDLHKTETNLGLSSAYNIAIGRARSAHASHLLLLDQDSVVAGDMVHALLRGIERGEGEAAQLGVQGAPVMVGPWYTDELTGRRSVVLRTGRFLLNYVPTPVNLTAEQLTKMPVMPTEMLISSGSLVAMPTFDALGELDDKLFIDHVDTDWCLRIKHSSQWMAVVPDAHMKHQLGDRVLRLWWGRWRLLPVHSPIRLYYTFRNSLWLYVRPHAHWRWILFDIKRLCAVTLIHMLAKGPRWPRLQQICKGLRDGLAGAR